MSDNISHTEKATLAFNAFKEAVYYRKKQEEAKYEFTKRMWYLLNPRWNLWKVILGERRGVTEEQFCQQQEIDVRLKNLKEDMANLEVIQDKKDWVAMRSTSRRSVVRRHPELRKYANTNNSTQLMLILKQKDAE